MTNVTYLNHGDKPTAAALNTYSTAITEAHTALGDLGIQLPAEKVSEAVFYLIHGYRYLHFGSNGKLVDPASVMPDVSLSEGDSGVGVLDLDTVGWLGYGAYYIVAGVSFCQEDWEP